VGLHVDTIAHISSYACRRSRWRGYCDQTRLSVCLSVCLLVCASTGKRLELSTPNLVHVYSIAVAQHALTRRSKGQRLRSHGYKNRHSCKVASDQAGIVHPYMPLWYVRPLPAWVCMSIRLLSVFSGCSCIDCHRVNTTYHKRTTSGLLAVNEVLSVACCRVVGKSDHCRCCWLRWSHSVLLWSSTLRTRFVLSDHVTWSHVLFACIPCVIWMLRRELCVCEYQV